MDHEDAPPAVQELVAQFETEMNNYEEIELKKKADPVAQALDLTSMFVPNGELYPAGAGAPEGCNRRHPGIQGPDREPGDG